MIILVKPLEILTRHFKPDTIENAKVVGYFVLPGGLILGNLSPKGSRIDFEDKVFYLTNGAVMELGVKIPLYAELLANLAYKLT